MTQGIPWAMTNAAALRRAAEFEKTLLGLAAVSGMPPSWCLNVVIEAYVHTPLPIEPFEIAKRMTVAVAFGGCSLDDPATEHLRWRSGLGYRWW